jgi:hypothetical protein
MFSSAGVNDKRQLCVYQSTLLLDAQPECGDHNSIIIYVYLKIKPIERV